MTLFSSDCAENILTIINLQLANVEVQLIPGCASDFISGGRSSFLHVSRFSTSTSIWRVRVSTYMYQTNSL